MTLLHAGHQPVRLVKGYRGNPVGCVLTLSPPLARRLVESGVAAYADHAVPARATPERAVGSARAETR